MKYLVTGGAGFIGSHLVGNLVDRGHEVVVFDNFSTGKVRNIRGMSVEVFHGDVRDLSGLLQAVQGVDTVFHEAAICSVARSMEDPMTTHEVNATGTLNVLEACRQGGVRRFVMASSSAIYGDSEAMPKYESMPAAPLSPYAVSKLIGEFYCRLYRETFGLETVALRYFNVFGPRQDPDSEYAAVIPRFLDAIMQDQQPKIYGDGLQTRDFTYVQNVVDANIAAAESEDAIGQVMNIACGNRYSLLDVLNRLGELLDCEVDPQFNEPRDGDVKHSQASIDKAEALLSFSPATTFEKGLGLTVDWFLSNQQRAAQHMVA